MNAFDPIAVKVVDWLAETSLQVALLVLLAGTIEWIAWRTLTAKARVWMWSLVLLRLALPPLHAPLPDRFVPRGEWTRWIGMTPPRPVAERAASEGHPLAIAATHSAPLVRDPAAAPTIELPNTVATEPVVVVASYAAGRSRDSIVLGAWFVGALAVFVLHAARELRLRRGLRHAPHTGDADLLAMVGDCARAIGLTRPVTVLVTDVVSGPAATGILRPRLLLPQDFVAAHPETERRCIVLHELAHLRARDPLANVMLALARITFWFHPLVHLALHRLQEAREEARDADALSVTGAPQPSAYALTLVDALERGARTSHSSALAFWRGHDWKRRLAMIQAHGSNRPLARFASSGVLIATAMVVAFGASKPGLVAQSETNDARPGIHVETYAEWPEWRIDVENKLSAVLGEVKIVGANLREALAYAGRASGLEVVISEDVDPGHFEFDGGVDLEARSITARELFELLLPTGRGVGATSIPGGLRVGYGERVAGEGETRFYSIAPLLQGQGDDEARSWRRTEIVELIQRFAEPRRRVCFDTGEYTLRTYRDLVVLRADRAMHAETKDLLDRLLAASSDSRPPRPERPYDRDLAQRLVKPVALEVRDESLRNVVTMIRELTGVSVVVAPDRGDEAITIAIQDQPLRVAVERIGQIIGLHPVVENGVVHLAEIPQSTVEIYDVAEFVAVNAEDEGLEAIDSLYDVIRSQIDPPSWDAYQSFTMQVFESRLVVRQTPANHRALGAMLVALKRALKAGS